MVFRTVVALALREKFAGCHLPLISSISTRENFRDVKNVTPRASSKPAFTRTATIFPAGLHLRNGQILAGDRTMKGNEFPVNRRTRLCIWRIFASERI